ncbi:MAG TPA: CpsB/CapC family capsule biosynthesis tyrosine phosphatase [Candidatus Nitrosocosmicus sp.]|nr:CpsB/CapC family capsule biosynthesis tyrosine phosphatase [Candidatus Nitrosocosmicus sp.]
MYDMHSHIIFGVDDGAASIEESVEMVRQAASEEVEAIIATPHYIEGLYANEYEDNLARLNVIKSEVSKSGINIKLYMGNEVLITPELNGLLKAKKITTLNNSRYLLVELPFTDIPVYTEKVIYDLEIEGYKVILAHPERNQCIIDNPNILHNLIKHGALVQMNIPSIEGKYGKRVKRIAQLMLQHRMVHFIGTDSHSYKEGHAKLKSLAEMMSDYCSEMLCDLFYENTQKIIKNEIFKINEPEKIKRLFLKNFN